jgi:glycosyltransferase involved in cell wall biosynthesis
LPKELKLIVEPDPRGHHLYYVKLLMDHCRSQDDAVVIMTTANAVESSEWLALIGECCPEVIVQPACGFSLEEIATVANQLGARMTILPEADHHLLPVLRRGWSGAGELTMLMVRVSVSSRASLSWTRPAKTLGKKVLIWLAGFRPRVRVFALRSPLVQEHGPLQWIPDPVALSDSDDEVVAIRDILDSGGRRFWLGVFGAITPRKNLPLIVEAIIDQPDIGLLLAGSVDSQVSAEVASLLDTFTKRGGRVVHLPGPLSEVQFDSAIRAVDCVVVAHSNEGPSGIVIKAAASGRRLVLAGAKSLRRDAVQLGEQAIWSPLKVENIRAAVLSAQRSSHSIEPVKLGASEFVHSLT